MPYTPPDGSNIEFNLTEPGSEKTSPLDFNLTSEEGLVFAAQATVQSELDYQVTYNVDFSGEASQELGPFTVTWTFKTAPAQASTETSFDYDIIFEVSFAAQASQEVSPLDVTMLLNFTGEALGEGVFDYVVFFETAFGPAEASQELGPVEIWVADVVVDFGPLEQSTEGSFEGKSGVAKFHAASYGLALSKDHVASYRIFVGKERSHIVRYGLALSKDHEASYRINNFNLVSAAHLSSYHILSRKGKDHLAKYYILTSDGVETTHVARYLIGLEGFVGLSERWGFMERPWAELANERKAHAHLYNRYDSDRSATYARYFESYASRFALAQRELIKDERYAIYERWFPEESERDAVTGLRYEEHYVTRNAVYERFYVEASERAVVYGVTNWTERKAVWWSCWNSLRYATLKLWYYDQRRAVAYGRPIPATASQRFGHVQLDRTKFDSTRKVFTDSYCTKVSCTINPLWQQPFSCEITGSWRELFSGVVVDEQLEFCPLPINPSIVKEKSLFLVYTLTTCEEAVVYDLGTNAVLYLPTQSFTGGTYRFEGWLFPTRRLLFLEAQSFFGNHSPFATPEEYFRHLQRFGYFTVRIGGEEMEWYGRKQINTGGIYWPLKVEVLIEKSLVDLNKKPGFRLKWAYPERSLDVYETVFVF